MPKTDYYRSAAYCGRTTLYKFRAFRSTEHCEWVRQIIAEHKIYFSRGSQLNDPFDLWPVFRFSTDRAVLLADAERAWARAGLSLHELQRRRDAIATGDLEQFKREAMARVVDRIESAYWVFSLAGNREHPMLWSHYAEGHTGLCIHFLGDSTSIFGAAQKVLYNPKRPVVPVPIVLPNRRVAELVTLHKGPFWRYEDEYRLVRYPDKRYPQLQFDGQHARFMPQLVTGITVGARMKTPEVDAVCELAGEHSPELPVWRTKALESYRFDFERVN